VQPVKKPKIRVQNSFIMPDGSVKEEHELTPGELQAFSQKVFDAFLPLHYGAIMRDAQRKKESVH
jgi:hypothetical protein